MRNCMLVSFLLITTCLLVRSVEAQKANSAPTAPFAQAGPTLAQPGSAVPDQTVIGRPDAHRYYWNNGQWWYHTPENTWLRWNGAIWVRHSRANSIEPVSSGAVVEPSVVSEVYRVPVNGSAISPAPSYRYEINRRRAGL